MLSLAIPKDQSKHLTMQPGESDCSHWYYVHKRCSKYEKEKNNTASIISIYCMVEACEILCWNTYANEKDILKMDKVLKRTKKWYDKREQNCERLFHYERGRANQHYFIDLQLHFLFGSLALHQNSLHPHGGTSGNQARFYLLTTSKPSREMVTKVCPDKLLQNYVYRRRK